MLPCNVGCLKKKKSPPNPHNLFCLLQYNKDQNSAFNSACIVLTQEWGWGSNMNSIHPGVCHREVATLTMLVTAHKALIEH